MTAVGTVIERDRLVQRGLRAEVLTIGWNLIEAGVAIASGIAAHSIALTGFGLDSAIELTAAGALFARLRAEASGRGEDVEKIERRALRVVGWTFFALAAYVAIDAAHDLREHDAAAASPRGIAISALALVVMPLLAREKLRVGCTMGSAALVADAKESFACAWLAAAVLLGVALNAVAGWWWADPLAALVMTPFLVREGREALEEARTGEWCCHCHDD